MGKPLPTVKKIIRLPREQDLFIRQKVQDFRQQVDPSEVTKVCDSTVIQGIIDWWMSVEQAAKQSQAD